MPAFNCERYIAEAIESVIAQTFESWELLVVDNGSSDSTKAIAESYARLDQRIQVMHEPRPGAAAARNLGINEARGRYIAFLDSDDMWLPRKLAVQLDALTQSGAALCYSAYSKIDHLGRRGTEVITVPTHVTYHGLLKTCDIGCLTAVYDTKQTGKQLMPEVELRNDYALWLKILRRVGHEDYAFWLRLLKPLKHDNRTIGIKEPLALYRENRFSLSGNKMKAALYQWLVYRKQERLGLIASAYYFLNYAVYGIRKYRRF
jgi:glycosyltransferase involved in cell wall biosynthesis